MHVNSIDFQFLRPSRIKRRMRKFYIWSANLRLGSLPAFIALALALALGVFIGLIIFMIILIVSIALIYSPEAILADDIHAGPGWMDYLLQLGSYFYLFIAIWVLYIIFHPPKLKKDAVSQFAAHNGFKKKNLKLAILPESLTIGFVRSRGTEALFSGIIGNCKFEYIHHRNSASLNRKSAIGAISPTHWYILKRL